MANHNNPEIRKTRATTETDKARRDEAFTKMVGDGVSVEEACLALGYSEEASRVEGYKLKKRLAAPILERQMARLSSKAINAVNEIYRLAMSATKESTRLHACRDILDRAGFKAVDRVVQETTVTNADEMASASTEQLEAELAAILKGTQLEGNGLDNVTVLPGVDPDTALDEWTPPDDFDKTVDGLIQEGDDETK